MNTPPTQKIPLSLSHVDALPELLDDCFSAAEIENIQNVLRSLKPKAAEWFLKSLNSVYMGTDRDWAERVKKFLATLTRPDNRDLVRFWRDEPVMLSILEDAGAGYLVPAIDQLGTPEGSSREEIENYDVSDYARDIIQFSGVWVFSPEFGVQNGEGMGGDEMDFRQTLRRYPSIAWAVERLRVALCEDYLPPEGLVLEKLKEITKQYRDALAEEGDEEE